MKYFRNGLIFSFLLFFLISCSNSGDKDNNPVSVTGVQIKKSTTSILEGNTEILFSNVLPANATNKAVIWSSSNETKATVSNDGLVTAENSGSVVIKVTTADGLFTSQCQVEVTTTTISVTGLSLNKSTTNININTTEQLVATLSPDNATNQNLTWESSDATKVQVSSNGLLTAVEAGTAIITVTSVDGNFTANCAVTIVVPTITIASITPTKSRNTSSATIDINGNNFSSTTQVVLSINGEDDIPCSNYEYFDSSSVKCTFDINNKMVGQYDIKAYNSADDSYILNNAFKVTGWFKVTGTPVLNLQGHTSASAV